MNSTNDDMVEKVDEDLGDDDGNQSTMPVSTAATVVIPLITHENTSETSSEFATSEASDGLIDQGTQAIATFIKLVQAGTIIIPGVNVAQGASKSEENRQADLDRNYKTPSFVVPTFDEKGKLRGYRNFRSLQVIQASVSRSVGLQIQHAKTPFEAVTLLTKMYSTTRMRDYMDMNNRFTNLRFRNGYDPARFVADFENCLEDFLLVGTVFPDEYKASTFLQKIPGTTEP